MAESERKNLSYIGQSAVLVLLALLMMGIHHLAVAHFHVQPGEESLKSVVAHVPREFSIALLIAAILNCVVERNTQRRHERLERAVQSRLAKNADLVNMNVRKNVLRAVFKQNLGKHVIAQIEAKLFQPTPYRVESDVSYNLSIREQPDRTKFVVIDSHIRYVVFNPSRQPVTVPLYFCTTSPDEFHEYTEIRDMKCDGVSVLNRAILPSCKRGGTIEYNEGAGCPVPPREHRVIEIFHARADYLESNESYVGTLPGEELRLTVTHPRELQMHVMALHPDNAESIHSTEGSQGWRLRGILPGQGLAFWWRPRNTSVVLSSTASHSRPVGDPRDSSLGTPNARITS